MISLRNYQEEAADFLYEHDRAMVLAPVGAGKTAITLTAMCDALLDDVVDRFLVLAPKRVAEHVWPVEAAKWAPSLSLAVAIGTPSERAEALASDADVVVTNYENLQWLAEQTLDFDAVVFDELTRLKNPSGKRFKALSKVVDAMKIRWGLTGSFTSNGLEDVFGQCKIVDQTLLGRAKGAFLQQYFYCLNREYNDWQPRPGALEAVMERIRPATYLLEPGEYRDQLPPLHVVPVRCQLDDRAPYEKMKKDFVVDFPDAQAVAANAAAVTMKLQQMAGGFVYNSDRTLAETPGAFHVEHYAMWFSRHKMQALADLLEENQRANTIIAYNFLEELAELRRWFPHAQTLDDDRAVERWNAGEIQLLLIHPKSAGHGLNLQSGGHHLVFTSLPWSLELYEQTIGRLHRSGQRHDVWVYLLLSEDTIDERILGALQDKRSLSDVAMEALK